MALPFAVALVTVPLYIAHIGTARFGVLAIVWILLGYFGFIDFGLSRASTNALAKLIDGPRKERVQVLLTSLYLNLFLGLIGGAILYFAGGFLLNRLLTLGEPIATEVDVAFPWIAGMLPLALLGGMCRGAIEARERFIAVNFIDLVGYVLGQVLPLLAAMFIAPTLPIVLTAAFAARAASLLIALGYVVLTEKINTFRVFDQKRFKTFLGFGAWVSVTNIIGPFLQFLDQLLVGSVLGATAVAHYTVPMNLVSRSQIVAAALARAMFPRFSRLSSGKALDLGESATVSLGFVYGAMCAPAIILSEPFMDLWMGREFSSVATPVLELLFLGAWINGIAFIPYSLLQGQGRPDLVAKLHTWEVVPYAALLYFALGKFGLFGAALVWNVRVAVDAVLLMKLAKFRIHNLVGLIPGLVLMCASYAIIQLANIPALWTLAVGALVFLIFVACAMIVDATLRRIALGLWHWPQR